MKRRILIWSILIAVLLVISLLTWPLPRLLVEGFLSWADIVFGHTSLMKTLGIAAAIIVAFALTLVFIIPILIYIIKKICFYVSVFFLCLFHHYRFCITRFPFASLGGTSDKSDVEITTDEGTLCLHFIDIVFPFRRALTIPNAQEYVLTPTSKGRVIREGGGTSLPISGIGVLRAKDRTLDQNRDRVKKLPQANKNEAAKHILLLQSMPNQAIYVQNGKQSPLTNGSNIENLTVLRSNHLKKGLKKQLHVSLFE